MDKNIKFSVKAVSHHCDLEFDILLYQGHWKCNEQVKPNVYYHHAKFDIYNIRSVWENPDAKVFDKPRHLTDKKKQKQ